MPKIHIKIKINENSGKKGICIEFWHNVQNGRYIVDKYTQYNRSISKT